MFAATEEKDMDWFRRNFTLPLVSGECIYNILYAKSGYQGIVTQTVCFFMPCENDEYTTVTNAQVFKFAEGA